MTEKMMIDLMLANQKEAYEKELVSLRAERDEMRVIIQAVSDHDDYIGRKTVMQVIDDWLAKYPAHPETKEEK
jgi:hypothetical protein